MSTLSEGPRTRFHLSLNTPDLRRAVAFYRVLFGQEPAKLHDDYAKFDLVEPLVVFSLTPHPVPPGGSLSHLGLRVPDATARLLVQRRLEEAGLATQCQEGTVCGYARQNKCWVEDPDRNFWEVYEIEEELDPALRPPQETTAPNAGAGTPSRLSGRRRSLEGSAARPPGPAVVARSPDRATTAPAPAAGLVVWEHYVTSPVPERIPHADGTVDEVRLVGTFNAGLDDDQCLRLVHEARRVLKPGGKVLAHGLMADRPFPAGQPSLPGLAALVARVPLQTEPLEAFRTAGFVGLQYVKFTEAPWFVHDGVEMREVKVIGWQPGEACRQTRDVIYKGPFRQATDEAGHVFVRGRRTTVPLPTWEQLRGGAAAEQFLFLQPGEPDACGRG